MRDPEVKKKIRAAAEAEVREFRERRAPAAWLADLAPLGTDWRKSFLETAPYLLIPVGYPARDAGVPVIGRKPLADVRLVV